MNLTRFALTHRAIVIAAVGVFLLFGAITATIRADTPTKALQVAS